MTDVPREVTDRQRAQQMNTSQIAARLSAIEDRPNRVPIAAPPRVHQEWRALIDELKTRGMEDSRNIKATLSLIENALTIPKKLAPAESQRVRELLTRLEDHLAPEPTKEEQHV